MANLLATCATDYGSSTQCWSSGNMKAGNFWVCSGADSFKLDQGGSVFDIWVSDSSISHLPRNILRACNNGTCIVLGQGCNANNNASIPVYACSCVQSPVVCATSKTYYGACSSAFLNSQNDYLAHCNQYGDIMIGPGNASWGHIITDRAKFYFNKDLITDGDFIGTYDSDLHLVRANHGTSTQKITIAAGTTYSCQNTCVCGAIFSPIVCATNYVKTNMLCSSNNSCIEFQANGEIMIKGGGAWNTHLYDNGGGSHIISTAQGGSLQFRNCTATNAWIYGCGRACFKCDVCSDTLFRAAVVCATTCIRGDGQDAICLTHANPYIRSGSSYIIMPNGLYVSGGTLYVQNNMRARAGICNDSGILCLDGGNDSGKCTRMCGKTFVCTCVMTPIVCATSYVNAPEFYSCGFKFYNLNHNSSSDRGPWNPIVSSIRGSGRRIYYDEDFHDGNNSIGVYNNSGGTAVTITRVDMSAEGTNCEAPNNSGQALRVCWDGGSASPNRGGIIQTISSARNKTFAQIFQACLPSNANLHINENAQGSNSRSYWLTNNSGTGKWEWYARISHAGNSGTFSTGGHISVSGPSSAFKWYIGSMTVYDVTDASRTCEDVIQAACCVFAPSICGTTCIQASNCIKIGGARFDNYADTRLRMCGSGDNSFEFGPSNDNGWVYIMSVNNSSGMYFCSNQGTFQFDGAHLRSYTDAEVDIGVSGGRFRCGYFSDKITLPIVNSTSCVCTSRLQATSCLDAPVVCATSFVKIGSHCICCVSGSDYIEFSGWTRFKPGLGVYSSANSAHFFPNNTSDHGAWQMNGSKGGYGGIYSCGWTWMTNSAANGVTGFYNDLDNEWGMYTRRNCESRLMYNGSDRFYTTTYGTCTAGCHCSDCMVKSPSICATNYFHGPKFCASGDGSYFRQTIFWPGSASYRALQVCKWTTGWNGGTGEAVWGLEWAYQVGTARRAQLFYDHNSSEEFVMQSNYGAIVFNATQNGNLDPNAAAERLRIHAVSNCVVTAGVHIACTCVQSPLLCATTCIRAPYIKTDIIEQNAGAANLCIRTEGGTGKNIILTPNGAGTVIVNGTGNNSGKSDFTVHTGGNATLALGGGEVRMGDSDVNWSMAMRRSGCLEAYGQELRLGVVEGNRNICLYPSGTGCVHSKGVLMIGGSAHGGEGNSDVIRTRNAYGNHNYITTCSDNWVAWNQWIRYVNGVNTWRIGTFDCACTTGNSLWRLAGKARTGSAEINYIVAGPRTGGGTDRVVLYCPYTRTGTDWTGSGGNYPIGAGGIVCAPTCLQSPNICFTNCLRATGGCIKVPIVEARYSDSNTNYRGGLCWRHLQLGNNGANTIFAGKNGTGGYLDIYTNTTNDMLGATTYDGWHVARFCSDGIAKFYYQNAEKLETYANGIKVCANSHSMCLYPSASWGHFYTTASKYYFDHEIHVNSGVISSYDEPLKLATCGTVRAQVCETCFCTSGVINGSYVCSRGHMLFEDTLYARGGGSTGGYWNGDRLCVCTCVQSPTLCSTKCIRMDQGNAYFDGGSCNGASDATVYVTAYNNNDWGIIVNKNADSASEYGLDLRMGATSTAAMYARFNNAVKYKLQYNCLCHDTMICSPAIKASSYMNSGKFCASSSFFCSNCACIHGTIKSTNCICAAQHMCASHFYGDGSNLTGVGGGLCGCTATGSLYQTTLGHCAMVPGGGPCSIAIGYKAASMAGQFSPTDSNNHIIAIGYEALNIAVTANCSVAIGMMAGYDNTSGKENTFIGSKAGQNNNSNPAGQGSVFLGYNAGQCVKKACASIFIGANSYGTTCGCFHCCIVIGNSLTGGNSGTGKMCSGSFTFTGSVSKSSGSFRIVHPNPAKSETKDLWHSFVESPNEGDNIYRYSVDTTGCRCVIELPDYYQYLNKNSQVWVSPVGHFGAAYGTVTENQECAVICTNADGCYNVLLIGTRKDKAATYAWNGTERDIDSNSPHVEPVYEHGDEDEHGEKELLSTAWSRSMSEYNDAYD